MILKGKSRSNGGQLASYLLSSKNEHVRVLDVRGTVNDDRNAEGLRQSLKDMDELGKMTKGQSTLFHLAINPNDRDRMTREDWQYSVAKVEQSLGLQGQPRVIVSHIYNGKEHLHVVWSRVDVEKRKCIEMSFSNVKLCNTAREIEIELGLKQTPARARGEHRLKQTIEDVQRQQSERAAQPRAERNEIVSAAWQQSKTGREFQKQIEVAGYQLAVGNRGVLVVDANNEPHSISRCVKGIKVKDVREKLGELQKELPHIDDLRPAKVRQSETQDSQVFDPEARRQRARNITKSEAQRQQLAANDNKPLDITPERARHLTGEVFEQQLEEMEQQRRRGPAP